MSDPDFIDGSVFADRQLPPETERAWAAGFFDGEGWIGTQTGGKSGRHTYLKMAVVQTELTTLERFNLTIGGFGRIYERTKFNPSHWSPSWALQINSQGGVIYAVNILWPYLSEPKRAQVAASFAKRADYRASWPAQFKLPQQRLSEDDVRAIRRLCADGVRRGEIAAQFGIHVTSVSHIKSGKLRGEVV